MAIPKFDADLEIISKLPDNPNDDNGYSAEAFKAEFDRAGLLVKEYINEILVPQANIDIDNASKGIGGSGVDGSSLTDGSVTASKLAANSVTTDKVVNDAITADKIAPKAVTEEAIADGSIGDRAYKQGSVTSAALAQNSVTDDKIVDGAVTNKKIANYAVRGNHIADTAVTRAKLANDALFSPIYSTGSNDAVSFDMAHLGQFYAPGSGAASKNVVYTLPASVSAEAPYGAEFPIIFRYGKSLTINFESGAYSAVRGDTSFVNARSYKVLERFDSVVLKKIDYATDGSKQYWVVIGAVEVVK